MVIVLPMQQQHDVGILLYAAALTQVGCKDARFGLVDKLVYRLALLERTVANILAGCNQLAKLVFFPDYLRIIYRVG